MHRSGSFANRRLDFGGTQGVERVLGRGRGRARGLGRSGSRGALCGVDRDESERRTYLTESLFLNTVKYENDKLDAYLRKIGTGG